MNKKGFCTICSFGSFFYKDLPCRDCVSIPSQFLSKEEITDADMPMGKKDRKELIAYKKIWKELEEMFEPGKAFYISDNKSFQEQAQKIMDLKFIIDELKEKYFPKPKSETELDKALEYYVKQFMQSIKSFLEDYYHIKTKSEREVRERNKKGGISC